MRFLFSIITLFFLGCATAVVTAPEVTHPLMPGKDVRSKVLGVTPVDCPGIKLGITQQANVTTKDWSRVFYVFFQTLLVKPYTMVDLAIAEYDPMTDDFVQAWVDLDGDGIADEYFSKFEDFIEKYKTMCDVLK